MKNRLRAARKRRALWVRSLDLARLLTTAERRSLLWTRLVHGNQVHQTTAFTCEDRYPDLFDLAAMLAPEARRILSFGCSTGEELLALRRRFAEAQIVGAEINPRSRRIAARRLEQDRRTSVIGPAAVEGSFDLVFALAVLQREPHKIADIGVDDLTPYYPFERFDRAIRDLADRLRPGGLLCVANAQYRVEDSSAGSGLDPIAQSPVMEPPLFGPDGRRIDGATARTMFLKLDGGQPTVS